MRSWGWLCIFVLLVFSTGGAYAQDAASPLGAIGTLEAGDFRALAVTADGDRLLVADAENQQVRIYDFSDPTAPALLSTLDVSGTPVLLAGGTRFGLVALNTDDDSDTIEVVAPAIARAPYSPGFNYIDIPKNPRALALSPDKNWGVAISDDGYTLLHINAPDDIESLSIDDPVVNAALSNTTLYLLHGEGLGAADLDLAGIDTNRVLLLDQEGTPSLVALNADATQGVIVLDGSRLFFFDPDSLDQTGAFTVRGSPITSVQFLTGDRSEYLLVTQEDSPAIAVFDTANPRNVQALPSTAPLDNPIQALTVFDRYLIVTDGATIRIFSA